VGILRFNHLFRPFDNPAIRRALLGAVDQADAMTAVAGTDRTNWHDGIGLFGAGTPLANDAGMEVMRGPRDYAAVKQALIQAGYNGEPIVVIAPTDDVGGIRARALSLVGGDQLRRAGMKVDFQEMDAGTVVRRRASQAAPDKGGLERLLHIDRPIDPEHQSFWQSCDTRRRARGLGWLADERAHRSLARGLAGRRRSG
jgi:peptide/nickel transport system substrate-binding protein